MFLKRVACLLIFGMVAIAIMSRVASYIIDASIGMYYVFVLLLILRVHNIAM